MRKKEADRLREIANILDDHSYDIYHKDGYTKPAQMLHWASYEIREVLINSGFNSYIDAKYSKVEDKWELNKEDK